MATLVQFDFPAPGPWGAEMAEAYEGLAADVANAPGLRWKIWTENADTQMAGGVYLFETRADAEAYVDLHTHRLQGFGVSGIRTLLFDVNEELSRTTRGPIN